MLDDRYDQRSKIDNREIVMNEIEKGIASQDRGMRKAWRPAVRCLCGGSKPQRRGSLGDQNGKYINVLAVSYCWVVGTL